MMKYLPTGNDYLALPLVNTERGCIESLNLLFMRLRGLVEVAGQAGEGGLLEPQLAVDGRPVAPSALEWYRLDHWLPAFRARQGEVELEGVLCPPVDERGFVWRLLARNRGQHEYAVSLGIRGCWAETRHRINYTKPLRGRPSAHVNDWFWSVVLEFSTEITLFALALGADQRLDGPSGAPSIEAAGADGAPIVLRAGKEFALPPAAEASLSLFVGVGLDEMAACAAVEEQRRKGAENLVEATRSWLRARARSAGQPELDVVLNQNLFFNYFYTQGRTLDTEQRVFVTSRSPRYYVSASYWDRDSLLWSLPALLLVEPEAAQEALLYAFTVQRRNFGVHSRYIDGVTLEPGFELDQLCAPVLALGHYLEHTDDWAMLDHPDVQAGLTHIQRQLQSRRHPEHALYATFLSPSDDFEPLPYETYGNVLVWRALRYLAAWAERRGDEAGAAALVSEAASVERAIWTYCLVPGPGAGPMLAWSTDLNGRRRRYDEPAGSLRLLPYLGFCSPDEPAYRRTLTWLRSPEHPYAFAGAAIEELGCAHNPHPWMLSLANGLLSGEAERARALLAHCQTDNGIAAEAVDEATGRAAGGEDFAACAGFLAYAIHFAFGRRTCIALG